MSSIFCTECSVRLPKHAEACPECGYPVIPHAPNANGDDPETTHATMKEYKLLQIAGLTVTAAGAIAALVDSPMAAAIAVTIGIATYITGLLGVWWNTESRD